MFKVLILVLLAVVGCGGAAGHDDADAGFRFDASDVPEVLWRFQCIPAPGGRADMGVEGHGATLQIWLDDSALFDCYAANIMPPCRGYAGTPYVYGCTTQQLSAGTP